MTHFDPRTADTLFFYGGVYFPIFLPGCASLFVGNLIKALESKSNDLPAAAYYDPNLVSISSLYCSNLLHCVMDSAKTSLILFHVCLQAQ